MKKPAIGFNKVSIEDGAIEGFAVWDGGPMRAPKKGEYFLSGAIPCAYQAKADMQTVYFIANVFSNRVGFLKQATQERRLATSARMVKAYRIVDLDGIDAVQPWSDTKTEARKTAKALGIYLCEFASPEFVKAYITCALWSSTGEDGENFEYHNCDSDDLAAETLRAMAEDCDDFCKGNAALLAEAYKLYAPSPGYGPHAQAGHDFWLTRNGHGAGFWDRGIGDIGNRLTDAAKVYAGLDLYLGDDGKIYS